METRLLVQLLIHLSNSPLKWPTLLVAGLIVAGIIYCKTLDKLPAILHEVPPIIRALNRSSQAEAVGEEEVRNQVAPTPNQRQLDSDL
jgi:type II secretory pathway component PulF